MEEIEFVFGLYSVFICSYFIGGCLGVAWGLAGGCLGVPRGLALATLTEPSLNPH